MIKEPGDLNFVLFIRGGRGDNFVFLFDLEIGPGNGKFDNSRRSTNYVNGAAKINCSPVRNRIKRAPFSHCWFGFYKRKWNFLNLAIDFSNTEKVDCLCYRFDPNTVKRHSRSAIYQPRKIVTRKKKLWKQHYPFSG